MEGASAEVSALLDTRTGESIPSDAGSSFGQAEGMLQYYETRFPGITADDLPYLQPQITYTFPLPLTPETLTFSFSTAPVAAYAHNMDLHLPDGTHITRISVSPIGIQLNGTCHATPTGSGRPSPCCCRTAPRSAPTPTLPASPRRTAIRLPASTSATNTKPAHTAAASCRCRILQR